MRITSSYPKDYLGRSGKELITSLGLKTNVNSNKYKKARYSITNVSMENISKIIKEFGKFTYKSYVQNRPKHKPNDSYRYLEIQIAECIRELMPLIFMLTL